MSDDCKSCRYNVFSKITDMPEGSILLNTVYKCDNKMSEHYSEEMGDLKNLMTGENIDSRKSRSCEKYESNKVFISP